MDWPWILAIAALLLLNAVATTGVIRNSAVSVTPRIFQFVLIWALPFVGAIVFLAFLATDSFGDPDLLDRTAFTDSAGTGHPTSGAGCGDGAGGDGE